MASSYEEAIAVLFQAPHESFVAERKRLAAERKAQGDKPGAARLLAQNRPPVSAWAVNQLWWQARDEVEKLFAAAARQRAGERAAAAEHRQQLALLRARASELLRASGHAASEGTLRRVTTTLAALAAFGGFEPEQPGALGADRDPPGFETAALGGFELASEPSASVNDVARTKPGASVNDAARSDAAQREAAQREAERNAAQLRKQAEERELFEQRRLEAERARRQAERARLLAQLAQAKTEFEQRERVVAQRQSELRDAESAVERARAELREAQARWQASEAED